VLALSESRKEWRDREIQLRKEKKEKPGTKEGGDGGKSKKANCDKGRLKRGTVGAGGRARNLKRIGTYPKTY